MTKLASEIVNEQAKESDVKQEKTDAVQNVSDDAAKEVEQEAVNGATNTAEKETNGDAKVKDEVKEEVKDDVQKDASPPPMSAHSRQDQRSRGGRGRGRGGGGNRRENIKTRFEDQPESNDPDEIRRQVEFYFSDSNLPIDAYLLSLVDGPKNRPVDLKTIHSFKRMRHFQPYSAVLDAVKQSTFLNVNDDGEVFRKVPLDKKFTDDAVKNKPLVHSSSMARSIYAKGFGEEGDRTAFDIESFFAPYGNTQSVRLRRTEDGVFKGSVFVEFDNVGTQKAFLELDPKPQWGDTDLDIKSKEEYVDGKNQGILEGTVRPRSQDRNYNTSTRPHRGNGDRYGDRKGRPPGISCYNCGENGHMSYDCDKPKNGNGARRRDRDDDVDENDWNARRDRDNRNDGRGRGRGGRGNRGGKSNRGHGDRDGGRNHRRSRSPNGRDDRRRDRRDRDDDNDADAGAAKEVDGTSKKRAREDEVNGEDTASKKVKEDVKEEV